MTKQVIIPVILAGGSGERLWPLSRTAHPKQFLSLLGSQNTLFQETLNRLPSDKDFLSPMIVCHEDYRFLVAEQLRRSNISPQTILLEPKANNTAPAIALAAHWAQQHYTNPILFVMPADHLIDNLASLHKSIEKATHIAKQSYLVTFGINPDKPETGYGYIQLGTEIDNTSGYKVARFTEKPSSDLAKQFIQSKNYLWNSGMFLFQAQTYLDELNKFQPEIAKVTKQAIDNGSEDLDFIRPSLDLYEKCPSLSIDYAVMEHTNKASVISLQAKWNDIGDWQSLWEVSSKNSDGNHIEGDVIAQKTTNCFIDSRHRLIATLDVHDLVITETSDAILIAKRSQSQGIKELVATLKKQKHPAATEHRQVMRPWGWYDSISKGERFQVKHIFVQPNKSLSLQLHHHRSEHWVIVKGSAKVKRDSETFLLAENESTFIPIGTKHQLSNVGKIPLEVIEIQSGSYLGEDDIVRFEDEHGRATINEATPHAT